MDREKFRIGDVGILDLQAVQERARQRSPCRETAMRLALAKAEVRFRVEEVRECNGSVPLLALKVKEPVPREHKPVLARLRPIPRKILVGALLFRVISRRSPSKENG
ncbi:MAG: hypothetical protein A2847_01490 [Candidatus Sungbacteria bacterium RIFCSPHIGHO2_01_FULL_50_25]|uniref:Uncharacterized protein n=1 Tax=Candidatus Sungbacteria bacterium RIFCSPHIGHO2_01_FULL_50_25 TaxID=1802265 RepID=A0A1G2K7I8_9BACT|nr:MAG: hypothetical protein A2847_01490 [Candidatus Sungbacteria bacterium RIFCSPHIGHO2_01_FULL_50_25]